VVRVQGDGLISRKAGFAVLAGMTALVVVAALLSPAIPQPLSYHLFADQRALWGIPNFGDVASNVGFAIVGVWGVVWLLRLKPEEIALHFIDPRERWFYVIVFVGMLLTAAGSSYYHLHPDNARLVWDRLPMTIVFMSLVAALIAERMDLRAGLWLLPVLLLIGAGSVVQWHLSEVRGAGDVRFYVAVQLYSVLFLVFAMLFAPRYTRSRDLIVVAGFYVAAKLLETFDKGVFGVLRVVSGHTLKHLAAAMASYWILRMLQLRRPVYLT
jgi:hypothetical protein